MAGPETHRSINLSRTSGGRFRATNPRGGALEFGSGHDDDFTPVELLLTAIGGCSGIDVDLLTSRRAEPDEFSVAVGADSIRDSDGNHLDNVTVTVSVAFPGGGRWRRGSNGVAEGHTTVTRSTLHCQSHGRASDTGPHPGRRSVITPGRMAGSKENP